MVARALLTSPWSVGHTPWAGNGNQPSLNCMDWDYSKWVLKRKLGWHIQMMREKRMPTIYIWHTVHENLRITNSLHKTVSLTSLCPAKTTSFFKCSTVGAEDEFQIRITFKELLLKPPLHTYKEKFSCLYWYFCSVHALFVFSLLSYSRTVDQVADIVSYTENRVLNKENMPVLVVYDLEELTVGF